MHRPLSAALGALILLAAGGARAQIIEQVVAEIGDTPIYASELMERVGRTRTREAYRAALEALIEERLVETEARRLGVRVDGEMVDRAVTDIRLQNGLEEEAFWQAVEEQGYARERYWAEIRAQLLRLRVVQLHARDELAVDDAELRRRYEARVAEEPPSDVLPFEQVREALRSEVVSERMQAVERRVLEGMRRRVLVILRI